MFSSPTSGRRPASARRLSACLLATFLILNQLAFVSAPPVSGQRGKLARPTVLSDDTNPNDTGTGSVSLNAVGTPATENFNTLANTAGSTTNTTLPTGWYITETGDGARDNEQYAVDTGGSATGDTYSYGAAGSTDRALGGLRSGTLIPVFGARFTNNTGGAITSLDIAYTGEQWRLGTAGRVDRIDFQISTNATDLSTGTYTDVNALDFTAPNTTAPTGAKDGNAAANRTALAASIPGLNIANGASFFIRWTDLDATGADDGLAVDDFSITPQGAGGGGQPALTVNDVSQDEGNAGTTVFTFTVSLSTATHGGVTFDIATADGTAQDGTPAGEDNDYQAKTLTSQTIPNGSDTYSFTVDVNGDTTSEPNETFFVNVTNVTGATVADGQGQGTIVNDDITVTPIHQLQGNGDATPTPGATVTTTGIVTLLRTSANTGAASTASGFFLQTPDAEADADPNTSQGIFVFTNSVPVITSTSAPVAVGDEVRVTGTVVEFSGLTEISPTTNISIIDTGNPLPTAVTITAADLPPTAPPTQPQLEKYEAMRVGAAALRSVSPNDNFFDIDVVLPSVPREQVFREPGIPASDPVPPDPTTGVPDCCIPIWDENPERLKLDTNGRAGAPNQAFTSNVTFTNVAGPLDFAFGEYRLVTESGPIASPNMSAIPVPTPVSGEFTVTGYNIENFNNNAVQREKVSLTVRTVLHYPDIIGAIEIFDLADLQALRDEINNDAVAAGDPNPMYEAYLVEQDGTSEDNDQDVGYLVKTARVAVDSVTQEREEETFVEPGTGTTAILHDRPPLVLRARVEPAGANLPVIVIVNHLRSFIDADLVGGDGPRVREKRKRQAESLAGLLQELQTGNPATPVISIGDYNAFQFNSGYDDSISVIKGNPTPDEQIVVDQSPDLVNPDFFNLIDEVPAAERYSFIFEGTPQVLDHVLVNNAAHARNTRIAVARVNSDFPDSPPAAFEANAARPERNSDHDPVVSYFSLAGGQAPGTLIISEFRLRGPGGAVAAEGPGGGDAVGAPGPAVSSDGAGTNAPGTPQDNDEFIEFYNNTDSDITVSTLDGSLGWALVSSTGGGQTHFIIPNGTVIPARGHYLAANDDGYSLGGYAPPDLVHINNIPDNVGIALFNTAEPAAFTLANRLDAVGPASEANPLYKEGTGYPNTNASLNLEHSFYRDLCGFVNGVGCTSSGAPRDTQDNATDFIFVDTQGTSAGPPARLGAPGPENLSSPIQRNAQIPGLLLDATRPAAQAPNRVRDLTSDPGNNSTFGTLSVRRRFVNTTGQNVTQLRFRVVQITTFPSPSGTADVRARTSSTFTISDIMDANTCAAAGAGPPPCTVTVQGTSLDEPPSQPNGGGWNSSLSGPLTIPAGGSVNVDFLLGVQQTGLFRFLVNVEAVTESPQAAPRPARARR